MEQTRTARIAKAATPAEREAREKSNFLRYCYHDGIRNVYADFHGLRHSGIPFVARGAGLKAAHVWADHSTPVLTAKYAHTDLADEHKALAALPRIEVAPEVARQPEEGGKIRKPTETKQTQKGDSNESKNP
jgi:hypothetical protein